MADCSRKRRIELSKKNKFKKSFYLVSLRSQIKTYPSCVPHAIWLSLRKQQQLTGPSQLSSNIIFLDSIAIRRKNPSSHAHASILFVVFVSRSALKIFRFYKGLHPGWWYSSIDKVLFLTYIFECLVWYLNLSKLQYHMRLWLNWIWPMLPNISTDQHPTVCNSHHVRLRSHFFHDLLWPYRLHLSKQTFSFTVIYFDYFFDGSYHLYDRPRWPGNCHPQQTRLWAVNPNHHSGHTGQTERIYTLSPHSHGQSSSSKRQWQQCNRVSLHDQLNFNIYSNLIVVTLPNV